MLILLCRVNDVMDRNGWNQCKMMDLGVWCVVLMGQCYDIHKSLGLLIDIRRVCMLVLVVLYLCLARSRRL